jgi:hypothetical protein
MANASPYTLAPITSFPLLAVHDHQDLASLDDRIPIHRRSIELRNSEIPASSSRSSSISSENDSRSRSRGRRASYSSIKEDDTGGTLLTQISPFQAHHTNLTRVSISRSRPNIHHLLRSTPPNRHNGNLPASPRFLLPLLWFPRMEADTAWGEEA